jgi:glycosyltransferase involved in cell wall biosynthesis
MGRTFKDELESLGFETGMIEVVTALFDGREFRQAKGFPAKTGNTIVFMSRLIREKGVYELLDAFQEIHRRLPTARLVIIGDGPEKNRMEEVVRLVGLTEFVSFTGFLEGSTKTKYLDAADLFVLPSYQEGCPVAMLEAMAAGAAVVASAVGGVPDIVKDGINGILLKTVHPQAISDACIRLLNDRARCRTLGEGNAETAWKKYEAKAVAARFEQIYLRSTAGSTRCTATPA